MSQYMIHRVVFLCKIEYAFPVSIEEKSLVDVVIVSE